ncbi:unnamed protein product [Knipowitschia caucasica]|uniref:Deoxycytidylate deaminase n=1 Tax=Knipowitschia caucasica TaxID=637954 RepID=A0AAV2LJE4_KNICA
MASPSGSADGSGKAQEAPQTSEKAREVLADDYYFMGIAGLAAKKSKDPMTQVGACIVNQEKKIVGVGYNGMPRDSKNLPWSRNAEKEEAERKYLYVCHAELNAIMNKNSADLKGCTMYVTLFPCNECAKLILQAGIKEVVYFSEKNDTPASTAASKKMLEDAAVPLRKFEPKEAIVIDFSKLQHHSAK